MRQFLYPTSRQFPFDEVCEWIVRALAVRNFEVPGISVEIVDYGSGAQKLRYVASIVSESSDVVIRFGRPQGLLPGGTWNDVAAVGQVQFAGRSLRVYQDESGPTYEIYVGNDWKRDRDRWDAYNAKLHGLPRTCVRYSGSPHYRGRPERLVPVDDYREYGPMGDEPRSFDTAEVMEQVREHLQDVVLPAIEAHPVVEVVRDVCAEPPPIPFPSGFGPFFAYGEGRDVRRIEQGRRCPDELLQADRYGLIGGGPRLAHTGIESGPDLPEVAYDGFLWCGASPKIPGERTRFYADQLVKVTPRDARGVYVADHAIYERLRAERAVAIEGQRECFTQEEVNGFIRARACSIVSILDYEGDYEEPLYLINRELSFDEVEVVGTRSEAS